MYSKFAPRFGFSSLKKLEKINFKNFGYKELYIRETRSSARKKPGLKKNYSKFKNAINLKLSSTLVLLLKNTKKKNFMRKSQFKQKTQHISWSTFCPKLLIGVHFQDRKNGSI